MKRLTTETIDYLQHFSKDGPVVKLIALALIAAMKFSWMFFAVLAAFSLYNK